MFKILLSETTTKFSENRPGVRTGATRRAVTGHRQEGHQQQQLLRPVLRDLAGAACVPAPALAGEPAGHRADEETRNLENR